MTTETETASSNKTPQEIESSDLAETRMSDSGIKNVEEPKADVQFEDTVEKTVDGETNKKYDVTNCEEEGEKTIIVAKADENAITEDMNGDYMAQSGQYASEDDEEDVMWEDDEENSEEDSEEAAADEDEVSEEDAINEDEDGKKRAEADYEENAEEDEENAGEDDEGNAKEDDKEKAEIEKEIAKGNVGEAEEHNKEKVEVELKNVKKSRGRRGKKEVGEETLKKLDSGDKAGSSRKRKAKKKVESMGMIFICSSKTKADCYKYRVLGLPESKKDMVEKIYTGMRVFLYDVDLKLMYGIYKAAGPGGYNIEPKAFKSQFPSQVRFTVLDDCLPLAEEKFKKIIKENYYTKTKFDCKLNSEQVKKLCKAFVSTSKRQRPKNMGISRKAEKQIPVRRDRTRRQRRPDDERRPPLREEAQFERPRKRTRKAISPIRQPLPPPVRSNVPLYSYNRTLDDDANRRDSYLETRDRYRDDRDRYRDERDPYLARRDPYRDGRDPYLVGRDPEPYLVGRDTEPYLVGRESRDLVGRDTEPYLVGRESRAPYRVRRDLYPEHQDPYRDGRASYLESRDPYKDAPHSEAYVSYRRDPILDRHDVYREDRRVMYRDPYRREEVPEPSNLETRRQDSYASYRERPLYAEPLYSAEYPTRSGVAREYRL